MNRAEAAALPPAQVLAQLETSADGLPDAEVSARQLANGHNQLPREPHGALRVLLRQFQSALVYVLLVACVLAFIVRDFSDGIIILVILLINSTLGFFQEYRAERTVEQLSKLISRNQLVVRGGKQALVDVSDLVPGDIIVLQAGDVVPADAKLLQAEDLQVNEAPLTGESVAVNKSAGPTGGETAAGSTAGAATAGDATPSAGSDENSLLFAGCTVQRGEGTAVIYATGGQTALGGIAALSTGIHRVTAYEHALQGFSTLLLRIIGLSLVLVLAAKLLIVGSAGGATAVSDAFPSLLLFIIALAVAVVPEALPVIATVTLSRGAMQLARESVVVKRLSAVEDLGNINLLCTDKTGTLTQNQMAVERLVSDDEPLFWRLAYAAVGTQPRADTGGGATTSTPDAFDAALLAAMPAAIRDRAASDFRRLKEVPFDPQARRRRVVVEDTSTRPRTVYLIVIGSVETLLALASCPHADEWQTQVRADGELGLRHLALAYAELHDFGPDFDILQHEDHLQLLGFVTLSDPLRPSTVHAVQLARQLGVTLKILSGDSAEVVGYVARQVGLFDGGATALGADGEPEAFPRLAAEGGTGQSTAARAATPTPGSASAILAAQASTPTHGRVLTGDELDALPAPARQRAIEEGVAFARVSPVQKLAIIQALQRAHYVVGYQGDGINDAPALKLADVGIAVDTATDVAKANADIILLKQDLAVIVNGIRYGRAIFANINKYINYTMVGNWGNFFALAALFLFSSTLPLLPRQVLLISLLTDVPLVAVATDTVAPDEIARPSQYDPHALMFTSLLLGSLTALFELTFFATLQTHPPHTPAFVETALYLFFTWTQLAVIFSVRTRGHLWQASLPSRPLLGAIAATFVIALALPYVGPLAAIMGFTPLPPGEVLLVLALVLLYLVVLDIVKVWYFELVSQRQAHAHSPLSSTPSATVQAH